MSNSPSPNRLSSSLVIAVGVSAIALAVGLPFLYIEVRLADFYQYASTGFGYWMATRVLPGWAVFAIVLGAIIGFRSSKLGRGLGLSLLQAVCWSVGLAMVATILSFAATAPYRAEIAGRGGLPVTPLSHVLLHHLFDSRAEQKIRFDPCILSADGEYGPPENRRAIKYEFCIPDVDSLRYHVAVIDTSVKFIQSQGGTKCGSGRILCVGSTRHNDPGTVLRNLGSLSFIRRISVSVME